MDHLINGAYSLEILANEGFGEIKETKNLFDRQ
jgi:hypothetical protein